MQAIQGLKKTASMNPLVLIDEIDKMGRSGTGKHLSSQRRSSHRLSLCVCVSPPFSTAPDKTARRSANSGHNGDPSSALVSHNSSLFSACRCVSTMLTAWFSPPFAAFPR